MKKAFTKFTQLGKAAPKRTFLLIFLCLSLCDLFLVRDINWLIENATGERFWVNYSFSLIALIFFMVLFAPIRNSVIRAVFIFFILGTQIAQLSYFAVYNNFVTVFDLRFVAADPLLTLELWIDNAALLKPLILLLIELPLLLLLFRLDLRPKIWLRISSVVVSVIFFLLLSFSWYGISKFQFSSVAYASVFPNLIERNAFEGKLVDKPLLKATTAHPKAPNIVFIVGESLNFDHLGIAGYPRPTTPRLQKMMDKGEMLLYRNAVSLGTRTLSSVPYMLTGLQGIDPHGIVYSSPTIFNYAKAAGYTTALITAQDFQWRNVDQIFVDQDLDFYRPGTDFSASVSVSEGADDMKVLTEGITPYLESTLNDSQAAPMMLVAQMNGSHYPYNTHSPDYIKQFLPEEEPNSINAYDNTVLYSDLYLETLVNTVRQHDPDAWVFFSSDHGQDISSNKTAFNSGYASGIIHNALMVFPPASAIATLKANETAPVSQADIFATILNLMQIKPVSEINGVDLMTTIDPERLRVVSAYMKTLHNEPNAVLVMPDLSYIHINFDRGNVKHLNGETTRYKRLKPEYKEIFDRRLNPAESKVQ